MADTFQIGDQVQLASGGPVMTVKKVEGAFVVATWFSSEHELKEARFNAATLKRYDPTPGSASIRRR